MVIIPGAKSDFSAIASKFFIFQGCGEEEKIVINMIRVRKML